MPGASTGRYRARPVVEGAERDLCRTGGQQGVRRRLVHKSWAPASQATAAWLAWRYSTRARIWWFELTIRRGIGSNT